MRLCKELSMIWRSPQENCRNTRRGLLCWDRRLFPQRVYTEILYKKKIDISHHVKASYDFLYTYILYTVFKIFIISYLSLFQKN